MMRWPSCSCKRAQKLGTVSSSFQTNCGSIEIYSEGPIVTLSAMCRVNNNQFNDTSVSLKNINNSNGVLVQGK